MHGAERCRDVMCCAHRPYDQPGVPAMAAHLPVCNKKRKKHSSCPPTPGTFGESCFEDAADGVVMAEVEPTSHACILVAQVLGGFAALFSCAGFVLRR